jgi:hypothetical protein
MKTESVSTVAATTEGVTQKHRRRVFMTLVGVTVGGIVLATGLISFWSYSAGPKYKAEALLVLRPFPAALQRRSFQRELKKAYKGISWISFQRSTFGTTSVNGQPLATNGVMRVILGGNTAKEAEEAASQIAAKLVVKLSGCCRTTATVLGPVQSAPAAAMREPSSFGLRAAHDESFPITGRVYFQQPRVSLAPGNRWLRTYQVNEQPLCDPKLFGKGAYNSDQLWARKLNGSVTNVPGGVAKVRPKIIPPDYKEQTFATAGGLTGMHCSFLQGYLPRAKSGGGLGALTIHNYVFINAESRCVVLTYTSLNGTDSAAEVDEMICKTLQVY